MHSIKCVRHTWQVQDLHYSLSILKLCFAMLVRDIFNMISTPTGALQAAEVTARAELCWRLLWSKRNSTVFLLVGLQLKKKIVYFSCNFPFKAKVSIYLFFTFLGWSVLGFFLFCNFYFVKLWVRPYNCFCTNYWHCCECQIKYEIENKNKTKERKVDNKCYVLWSYKHPLAIRFLPVAH